MAISPKKSSDISFSVNILIKEEKDFVSAHCLELDIVATGKSIPEVEQEIISLICAQIDYAFANDNFEYLYHPAPPEVWKDFFSCTEQIENRYKLESEFQKKQKTQYLLPPWLIVKTCQSLSTYHV